MIKIIYVWFNYKNFNPEKFVNHYHKKCIDEMYLRAEIYTYLYLYIYLHFFVTCLIGIMTYHKDMCLVSFFFLNLSNGLLFYLEKSQNKGKVKKNIFEILTLSHRKIINNRRERWLSTADFRRNSPPRLKYIFYDI